MARGIKESVLIGGGALLVLLTVLLLVSLGDPAEQEEAEPSAMPPPAAPTELAQPVGGSGTITAPAPAVPPRPAPSPPAPSPAPPAVAPAPPPLQLDLPNLSAQPVAREVIELSPAAKVSPLLAPSAEPLELDNEPDPKRREMLRKMHKLAEAKMRQGVFTRRARLLEQSMAEGQASGTWTRDKVNEAQVDLKQLLEAVKDTNAKVDELKAAVDQEVSE